MAKKVVELGAPAYMSQFTALMTILLAFFILLQTLAKKQETGFNEGIGDVRNAFGIQGGLGIFSFTFVGGGGSKAPNPSDRGKEEEHGIHEDLVKSSGGMGNTDASVKDHKLGKYLRLNIEGNFMPGEDAITPKMALYLNKIGMGLALFDYKISIRCYSDKYENDSKDRALAINRAAQIMRYLNQRAGVPYSRMNCVGYTSASFFGELESSESDKTNYKELPKQGNYFYIYIKPKG
jgi:chemotaxis protein MotB